MAKKKASDSLRHSRRREEGGKHAIKGFVYQFDKTLCEVFDNPNQTILFEQQEDVQYEDFFMQIKHRECSKYYPSSIRQPVKELIKIFKDGGGSRKLCLYCHFKDRKVDDWRPSTEEIKTILGKDISDKDDDDVVIYDADTIKSFAGSFKVVFAENYEVNFATAIGKIKKSFSVDDDTAHINHAIFRAHLFELACGPIEKRKTSMDDLRNVIGEAQKIISLNGYQYILEEAKYNKFIKKLYFTPRGANINNFQRLVSVDCDSLLSDVDAMRLVKLIGDRYYKKDKSPQPFMLLRNLNPDRLIQIKRGLIEQEYYFNDGTFFDGDIVRATKLFIKGEYDFFGKVKFWPEDLGFDSEKLVGTFQEIFDFHISGPLEIQVENHNHIKIPITKSQQVSQILS